MKSLKTAAAIVMLVMAGCSTGQKSDDLDSSKERAPSAFSAGLNLNCVGDNGQQFRVLLSPSFDAVKVCVGTTAEVSCGGADTVYTVAATSTDENGDTIYGKLWQYPDRKVRNLVISKEAMVDLKNQSTKLSGYIHFSYVEGGLKLSGASKTCHTGPI